MKVSVAIMHHPARAHLVDALVRACLPLVARVVTDPEPAGVRSPLRTAKRAWAAVGEGATHHLVIQDDALLCDGFAAQVQAAVAARPRHVVALYSDWNSPQNSYLVRRAAAAGAAWAPLSRTDWAPAVALLMPADRARELAAYLAPIPDEVIDDDELIAQFCRERRLPMLATVPHLVEKGNVESLTAHEDLYHATVFAGRTPPPAAHWARDSAQDAALAARFERADPWEHVVELRGSRCYLRFTRPRTEEPAGHEYGWYWHDWAPLIGIDPRVVRGQGVRAEVWAAGYLLGADTPEFDRADWLRPALATWVESGLRPADRSRLGPEGQAALTEACLEGFSVWRTADVAG
ncbi:hypothetical protein ACTMTF_39905 [Nonomuraea sp. ZG12]|uniref:hypothetical protein n=1 Tax=Nonomuraea sp. ZG12 TaxID=3452207 RepID=UPI003F8B9B8C